MSNPYVGQSKKHREHETITNDHARGNKNKWHEKDGMQKKTDPPGKESLNEELAQAIKLMVANISKSFIVDWYTSISPTNHDFVASCDELIEEIFSKFALLCVSKLDQYKIGQLVTSLLHDHVLNDNSQEKLSSIENQIDNHEYDICQSTVVRLFGLLSNDSLRRLVFTNIYADLNASRQPYAIPASKYNQQHRLTTQRNIRHMRSSSYPTKIFDDRTLTDTLKTVPLKTTSALYTLVIALLTKAAFLPIIDSISEPKWLYAVIIWLCKKEELEQSTQPGSRSQERAHPLKKSHSQPFTQTEHRADSGLGPSTSIVVTNLTGSYRYLDSEEGIDIAAANINFDNPICDSLKRPLDNIEIYATEEVKSNNSCYVLYCIRYDGLCYKHPSGGYNILPEYPNEVVIDKRQMNTISRRIHGQEPSAMHSSNQNLQDRKSFRRSMTIRRRFREFVLLQLRLEENPKIRPYMKNIPKPTKLKAATQNIFSLPGITNIKLDQSTIKLRQRFLERFLVALNNSPFIANSYEFKEFFSYNVNSTGVNVAKSKSTILQVNLNKVFVDSVRSAFTLIRSTLPGDDYHSLRSNPDPDAWLTELQQSTMKLHVQTRTSHSKMNLERLIDSKLLKLSDSPTRSAKSSSLTRNSRSGAFDWMGGSRGGSLKSHLAKSNSISSNTDSSQSNLISRSSSSNSQGADYSSRTSSTESIYHDALGDPLTGENNCNAIQICNSYPIASKLIDIVHYSLSGDTNCSKLPSNIFARFILGRVLEGYAIKMLTAAMTLKNAAFCINGITNSIWGESGDPPLDLENASLDEAITRLTDLVEQTYVTRSWLPKQILRTFITRQLRFYLSQLMSQKRNKFVIYSFLVHLLDELETQNNMGQDNE